MVARGGQDDTARDSLPYEPPSNVEFVRFTHNNRSHRLDPQTVQRALAGVAPESLRRWWVEIGGQIYPVNQAFEIASGMHRSTFNSDLSVRTFNRLGFRTGQLGTGASRQPRQVAPAPEMTTDREALSEAAVELVTFLRERSLTKTLPATEASLVGGDRAAVNNVRLQMAATRPMADVARMLWQERGKLRQIVNATTTMLAIEAMLEDGEEILTAPSLRTARTGHGFDLATNVRVANFELDPLDSETRQRVLFQRFVDLALDTSERVAQLWVGYMADANQVLFESDQTAEWGLRRSSRVLRERFKAQFGELDMELWYFAERHARHVQVRDVRPVVSAIPH